MTQIIYGNTNPFAIAPLETEYQSKVYSMNAEGEAEAAIARCLLNTSGKVYSIQQGKKISQPSNTKRVKVTIEKTGGKAKTKIKICLPHTPGNFMSSTVKKEYTFENGNYKRTKTFTIFKAKDSEVIVYIDNKSVANTFSYKLRIDEID
ncbi:MAG: hypothetical protein AAF705_05130 [Bacteroidota bacterium]